jgi:hypothetical protein
MTSDGRTKIPSMLETILARLGFAIVPRLAAWARRAFWQPLRAWATARRRDIRKAHAQRAAAAKTEAEIAEAAAAGAVVVMSATGINPTKVVWAGAMDETTYDYTDHVRYRADVEARRVPYLKARCCRPAPRVGERARSGSRARGASDLVTTDRCRRPRRARPARAGAAGSPPTRAPHRPGTPRRRTRINGVAKESQRT